MCFSRQSNDSTSNIKLNIAQAVAKKNELEKFATMTSQKPLSSHDSKQWQIK